MLTSSLLNLTNRKNTKENQLRGQFCGIPIESILMNASGCYCTISVELKELNDCEFTGALVTKSCTEKIRGGNEQPRYHYSDSQKCSINSTGLANLGADYYINLPKRFQFTKPYIISVSGKSIEENIRIFENIKESNFYSENTALIQNESNIQYIEVNASCPNIKGQSQTGYNFESLADLLDVIGTTFSGTGCNVGIKLPPYFDEIHFRKAAGIINRAYKNHNYPNWVTCINSPGNGLVLDPTTDQPAIKPKNGYGGIGGPAIKPFALANVNKMKTLLHSDIQIIGCGGVSTGRDAYEHLLCGADIIQIGTELYNNGIPCFERISKELSIILKENPIKK